MLEYGWLIAALPLAAGVLQAFFGRRLGRIGGPMLGILAMAGAFVVAVGGLLEVIGGAAIHRSVPWITIGELTVPLGFQIGGLESAVMVMITFVSLMVQIYSIGYMKGDSKYNRYFTVVSIFTFGMLFTVMAENLILFLIGWEVMSFASFSLIGHWFEEQDNARAALKAFITTGLADLGFMAGAWLLISQAGTASFGGLMDWVSSGAASPEVLTLAGLLLFWGAAGKSAQVPLHAWLPDAMAGPTPGSALIHAATMVAAGVFLVTRNFFIFEASGTALTVVAVIGAITALMAASIAVVQDDIKKVLAYSTISQLGYMMLSLGVLGPAAAVFHLITHGFFKALLFLGSGSVIMAAGGEQDMRRMGGLFRKLPVTGVTFIIGSLALAGIWPFAGFYSKDEILLAAFNSPHQILFWMGIMTALLTAYYMTRSVWLTFFGEPRDKVVYERAQESPAVVTVPLVLLAVPSIVSGLPGAPGLGAPILSFLGVGPDLSLSGADFVLALATGSAVFGIVFGYFIYGRSIIDRDKARETLQPLHTLLVEKYYFDHLYHGVVAPAAAFLGRGVALFDQYVVDGIVNGIGWVMGQLARLSALFDMDTIDGIVNGIGGAMVALGRQTRRLATGAVQVYMMALFVGILIGLIIFQVIG